MFFKKLVKSLVTTCLVLLAASLSLAQGSHGHAKISAKQATNSALKKYPGKVVGHVNLENEDGQWQYSVNIKSGKIMREVMVDAHTGKVASVEVTTKEEEAKEAAAEKTHAKKAHSKGHK